MCYLFACKGCMLYLTLLMTNKLLREVFLGKRKAVYTDKVSFSSFLRNFTCSCLKVNKISDVLSLTSEIRSYKRLWERGCSLPSICFFLQFCTKRLFKEETFCRSRYNLQMQSYQTKKRFAHLLMCSNSYYQCEREQVMSEPLLSFS